MLGITVWLDGKSIEITGTIDPESVIVHTPSSQIKIITSNAPYKGLGVRYNVRYNVRYRFNNQMQTEQFLTRGHRF